MKRLFTLTALLLATPALAEPPSNAQPNSATANWYRSLKDPNNTSCCSEADCRPVQARFIEGQWEAFIDKRSFGFLAPDAWMPVPENVLIEREDNPTGHSVACWAPNHGFYCLTPMTGG